MAHVTRLRLGSSLSRDHEAMMKDFSDIMAERGHVLDRDYTMMVYPVYGVMVENIISQACLDDGIELSYLI